jgi:hypothetical protein
MVTTNWLYIGNFGSQINPSPSSNVTQTQANALNGWTAEGRAQLAGVQVTGSNPISNAWRTTYQSRTSNFTYNDPATGNQVNTQISTFVRGTFSIETLDEATGNFITVIRSGIILQDSLGNLFIRPAADDPNAWDDIRTVSAITINSATVIASDTRMATLGFSPNVVDNIVFVCFATGTLLRTADGQIPVEDVQKGDLLWTRDHGLQPVGWIGSRRLSSAMLAVFPNLRPIRIRAGALGDQIPATDLVVSPQHRVLVRSAIAERMFNSPEVLVAAKHLLALDGIEIATDVAEVEYFHVMFDAHQVVMSNGAETESLYPGPESIKALPAEAVAEIYTLFPELRANDPDCPIKAARPMVKGRQGRRMAERHQQNHKALVD